MYYNLICDEATPRSFREAVLKVRACETGIVVATDEGGFVAMLESDDGADNEKAEEVLRLAWAIFEWHHEEMERLALLTLKENDRAAWYDAYLLSRAWIEGKRDPALKRSGFRCDHCLQHGRFVHLEVHHKTYDNVGDERPEDLEVLCTQCHQDEHGVSKPYTPRTGEFAAARS